MIRSYLLLHRKTGESESKSVGFFRTRIAAEEDIMQLRWQPAYREHQDGFIIEEYELATTVHFSNNTGGELELTVEPWGALEVIPAGSKFAIHYAAPKDGNDTSLVDLQGSSMTFWCEGDPYDLVVDGIQVT